MLNWIKNLFKKKSPEPVAIACTECGSKDFYEGPSGGLCHNIMCANDDCKQWFNLCGFDGHVLAFEKIDRKG